MSFALPEQSLPLIQLPLWLSILVLAFVLAERRYRQLLETLAAWASYVIGSVAILPLHHAQSALAFAGWILVGLLAWIFLGGQPGARDLSDPPDPGPG